MINADPRWRETHLVNQIEALHKKALSGDVLAANELLRNAMVALSHVIDAKETRPQHIAALTYLHQSLRSYIVDGIPLERSFCIEADIGAPAKNAVGESVYITTFVDEELIAQQRSGQELKVGIAIKKAANKIKERENQKCSISKVRSAWELCGGLAGFHQRLGM